MRVTRLLGILFFIAALFIMMRGPGWAVARGFGALGCTFVGMLLVSPRSAGRLRADYASTRRNLTMRKARVRA